MSNRRSYTIKAGDTLSAIAKRELGDANRWHSITKSNGESFSESEARRLAIGQIVYLPTDVNKSKSSEQFSQSIKNISENCLKFIAQHEGVYLKLYNDPANHATIGIGHLVHYGPINGNEPDEFKRGITQERALELLSSDIIEVEQTINTLVKVPLNQNQFDALVSFVFNIGATQFAASTLLKKLNAGQYNEVPSELNRWVYGSGKKLPGLVTRRLNEGNLFTKLS